MVVSPIATLTKSATIEAFRFAQLHLLLFGELDKVAAFIRAGMGVLFYAGRALNKEQVAGIIGTIDMGITGRATLMAFGNDFGGDAFTQSLIKDEILSEEVIFQSFFLHLE